jgi:ubiquinone/menaquinone biosynthesis C-methylase UbiE
VPGVSDSWPDLAGQWLAWSRTPGHDVFFTELNLPWLAELIETGPHLPRRTLDIGCGEGRLGRWLAQRGHRVCGIDISPGLAQAARESGGYEEIVSASASELPWPDASFDLAIACMTLQDMTDPVGAITEAARVLAPGGALCVAMPHPVNRPPQATDYFADFRARETIERGGVSMQFDWVERPLAVFTDAIFSAGFVIEDLREPRPSAETVERVPELERAARLPFFLHLRCRLPAG